MDITFVEDRPWVVKEAIEKMEHMDLHTIRMVYYKNDYDEQEQIKIQNMCQELGIELCCVNNLNFDHELDRLYQQDKNMIFFFDMDLNGDYSFHFEERINVIYALKKQQEDDFRIWFYSTGPAAAIEQINANFPDHNIPVVEFRVLDQIIVFDYNFIQMSILDRGCSHVKTQ